MFYAHKNIVTKLCSDTHFTLLKPICSPHDMLFERMEIQMDPLDVQCLSHQIGM